MVNADLPTAATALRVMFSMLNRKRLRGCTRDPEGLRILLIPAMEMEIMVGMEEPAMCVAANRLLIRALTWIFVFDVGTPPDWHRNSSRTRTVYG